MDGQSHKLTNTFCGFSEKAPLFLEENNMRDNKQWFEEHRHLYNEYLLDPFKSLISSLSETMHSIDPLLDTKPVIGRTISKIYRDIRFSRNKSLFHSAMWLTFKRREENWKNAPAFFFEITPENWHLGMGYFSPSRDTMDAYRFLIDEDRESFLSMTGRLLLNQKFEIMGDMYNRPLLKEMDQGLFRWYNRKNLYISQKNIDFILINRRDFSNHLKECFIDLSELYKFMRKASDYNN